MLPGRALARTFALVGVAGVISAGLATGTAFAVGFAATSRTPAAGAIVQPGAVTIGAPIQICFTAAVFAPMSSVTLAGPGGSISGASVPSTACPAGPGAGLTFTPASLPLVDGDYTASYSATDSLINPVITGSWGFRIDGTAPPTPSISNTSTSPILAANASAISVTGSAEASHAATSNVNADPITVLLTVHSPSGGTDVTRTTTTDSSGNYAFSNVDVHLLADNAAVTYAVTASDTAGNTSGAVTKAVVKDTAPAALTSSTPSDGLTHKSTSQVVLTFNQPLDTAASQATIANHLGTQIQSASGPAFSNSNQTMTVPTTGPMTEAGNPYTASFTVFDVNGNPTAGLVHFTIDDTAPDAPTDLLVTDPINTLNQSTVTVSGSAEPLSTVEVTLSDGPHHVTVSNPAAADGSFTVTPIDASSLNDATSGAPLGVSVTATDPAGNTSTAATTSTTKDTVVPAQPGAVTIAPNSVNNTTQPAVTVSGTVAADVTSVHISVNDTDANTAPVQTTVVPDGSHAYSTLLDLSSLSDGTLTATVVAFDVAGNPSQARTATATKDAGVPPTPLVTISPKPVNAAHAAAVTVNGVAEASSTVHVSITDQDAGSLAHDVAANPSTGAYTTTFDLATLHDGVVTASATAEDAAHNVSSAGTDSTTLDTQAPAAPALTSVPAFANKSNVTSYTVSGTAEPGSVVDVTLTDTAAGTVHGQATAAAVTGAWSVMKDLTTLADGALSISAIATDAAGNVSSTAPATATKDTVAPTAAPVVATYTHPVDAAHATDVAVTGVNGAVEPDAGVTVTINDANPVTAPVTGSTVADDNGAYSITDLDVSGLDDGTIDFTVTQSDAAGNPGTTPTQLHASKDTITLALVSTLPSTPTTQTPAAVVLTFNEPIDTTVTTLTVKDSDNFIAGGNITFSDGNTKVTFTPSSPFTEAASPYAVTFHADDVAGDPAVDGPPFSFVVDNTPPAKPVVSSVTNPVNAANVAAVAVSGTAEPGSSVLVDLTDGTHHVTPAAAVADGGGAWSLSGVDVSSLSDGAISATAVATDAALNASPASDALTSAKDTVAPAKPVVSSVTNPVNVANVAAVAVSGTAEPGSSVQVNLTDGTHHVTPTAAVASGAGAWSVSGVDVSSLSDGTISATAVATDAASNASPVSDGSTSTKDTVAPARPVVSSVTNPVNAANVAAVAVSGTAEPGSSVQLDLTDGTHHVTPTAAVASGAGAWSVSGVDVSSLSDGAISATAVATDAALNASPVSDGSTSTKDAAAPAKPVVSSVTSPVNAANVAAVAVSGTAEPGSSVQLNLTDGTHHVTPAAVVAGSGGAWSVSGIDVSSLSDGTISTTAVATDAATNSSPASAAATAAKDTVAPAKPVVSSVTSPVNAANAGSVSVAGTGEPGSAISLDITDGTKHLAPTTTANSAGAWSLTGIDVRSLADGTLTITATATDAVGNVSSPSDAAHTSKATGLPGAPQSVTVSAGDTVLGVSWAAPASNGGYAVTSYTVSIAPHGGATLSTFTTPDASTLSHSFSGLTNGTAYDVSVVANNVAGPSAASSSGSGTPKFVSVLSAKDSAAHIVDGAKVTLSGVLTRSDKTGVAGATVTVFRKLDGKLAAPYLTLITGSTGAWSSTLAPVSNATYFASYTGSGSTTNATSPNVRTTVAPKISITSPLNKSTSSSAKALKVTGRVAPNKAGRVVVLYYMTKTGKLVRLTAAKVSSKSTYVLTTRLKRGAWRLVVLIGSSPGNTLGRSAVVTLKRT